MTILLTIGSGHSGAPEVFELLREAGIAAPQPSADGNFSPENLQSEILRSLDVDPNHSENLTQVDIGSRWHQTAVSLLKANEHLPLWGWSAPASVLFMDFWLAVDAGARILMVYSDPANELVRSSIDADTDSDAAAVLRGWQRWNDALLRYHFRHPDRTLLVNGDAALAQPGKLLALMASTIGTRGLQMPAAQAPAPRHAKSLLLQAAQVAVCLNDEVRGLHQEIHDASALNGSADPQAGPDAAALWDAARGIVKSAGQDAADLRDELGKKVEETARAWQDIARVQAEVERLTAQCHQAAAEQARTETEYERVRQRIDESEQELQGVMSEREQQRQLADDRYLQIDRLKEQLAGHQHEVDEREQRLAQHSDERQALQSQLDSLREDKELVELQLQQVQEELAYYFKAWQEERTRGAPAATPAQAVLDQFWRTQQPDALVLDLRRPITGEHWYEPEADGRWSGPEAESGLHLPPIQPGHYTLELDVMDTMDPSIIDEAQLELQGRKHPLNIEYFGGERRMPAVCSARVEVLAHAADEPLLLALHLPMTISPTVHGSDDTRHLGMKLQQVRLIRDQGA